MLNAQKISYTHRMPIPTILQFSKKAEQKLPAHQEEKDSPTLLEKNNSTFAIRLLPLAISLLGITTLSHMTGVFNVLEDSIKKKAQLAVNCLSMLSLFAAGVACFIENKEKLPVIVESPKQNSTTLSHLNVVGL